MHAIASQSEYRHRRFAVAIVSMMLLGTSAMVDAEPADLPFGMMTNHLNLVFSVSDEAQTHRFYGEILGLERMPNIDFPGESFMVRYLGGESEIKFIVTGQDLPKHEGGTRTARGIRLLALLLPESKQAGIVERLKAHDLDVPEFAEGKSDAGYRFRYGMVYDYDGNQVELVFLDENAPAEKFSQAQIGLTVSDSEAMETFLTDILGIPKTAEQTISSGLNIRRHDVGVSQIKYWQGPEGIPAYVGGPSQQVGMCLVQFIVPNVDTVRESVLAKGGKIAVEPFPLGTLATIMFVEGPDGILFEFAGPLLARFREESK